MTPRKAMICSLSDSFLILSLGVTASKLLLCCSWNHRSLDLLSIHVEDDVFKRRIEDHIFDLKWPWPAAAWNGAWVPSQRLKSGPRGQRNHLWLLHPGGAGGKEPAYQCRRHRRLGFNPWVRKIPWRRAWQPTPVFLPGESQGQREPGGLQAMGSQRVGHNWSDLACMLTSGQRQGPDFCFAEKFPQRLKAVIQVKCLLGGERVQCKWIDKRWAQRESPTRAVVWITFMEHFFWVSSGLALPGSESVWFISGSSRHVCTSQPRWIPVKRSMGSCHHFLCSDAPLLFDLQGAFLWVCSQGGLLNLEDEENVISCLISVQGPASSAILLLGSFCCYGVSVHGGETVKPGAQLSPDSYLANVFSFRKNVI